LAKLTKQQLRDIKLKVRQQKAEEEVQNKLEELKLKESGNAQSNEAEKAPTTLAEVKEALQKQKQEAAQSGQAQQTQKQKLKKIKREVRDKLPQNKGKQMTWNCTIGDLVEVPSRWTGTNENLIGIVVKESIDKNGDGIRIGAGAGIATDSTQFQILTTGGFKWVYAKGLKKIEVD